MQDLVKSISFRELSWDDVDNFAKGHGFKDRSPFIEYCVSKQIHKKKLGDMRIYEIIMLLLIAMTSILVMMLWLVK